MRVQARGLLREDRDRHDGVFQNEADSRLAAMFSKSYKKFHHAASHIF
jgi:hypothetical protein